MPSLTRAAEVAYAYAGHEAGRLESALIDVEHVFLGLCQADKLLGFSPSEPGEAAAWQAQQIRGEAAQFAGTLAAHGLDVVKARRRLRALWAETHPFRQAFSRHRTPRCREMFTRADDAGPAPLTMARLMVLTLEETSPLIEQVLTELAVPPTSLLAALSSLVPPEAAPAPTDPDQHERFGRDLTKLARAGRLREAVGRGTEIKQVARILMHANKGNALLVGDAGVGKTAIVEGLALKLASPTAPAGLRELHLIEISITALLAGTKYRGEFEERLQSLIDVAKANPSLIWFVDELHMLAGAGGGSGSMDAAGMLKPALARGEVRLIGATTISEYRRYIEPDAAWERRFQVVWVDEPTREVAVEILEHLRPQLEAHHALRILPSAVDRAVELSVRCLPDRRLPDKAIDVLDRACARRRLVTFSPAQADAPALVIGPEDVSDVVAEMSRVPTRAGPGEQPRLLEMEEWLGRRVLGQQAAIRAVADVIRGAKAGFRDTRRPLGIFLFLGPTGTGKTELAKALAEFLFESPENLIHVDMSEYAEKHAIARLIGSPPGYVGHEEGGRLVEAVRTRPSSVVLFDEIEKAHPDVFDLFLQIFDEGRLTDARGRRASFTETVIVLTSNLGGSPQEERRIGFVLENSPEPDDDATAGVDHDAELRSWKRYERLVREAVGRVLRPELRNRLDKEIVFRPLTREIASGVFDKFLGELNARLAAQRIVLEVDDAVRERVVTRGFTPEMGARAMRRALQELIEQPLSGSLLAGDIRPGQRVRATLREEGVQFVADSRGTRTE